MLGRFLRPRRCLHFQARLENEFLRKGHLVDVMRLSCSSCCFYLPQFSIAKFLCRLCSLLAECERREREWVSDRAKMKKKKWENIRKILNTRNDEEQSRRRPQTGKRRNNWRQVAPITKYARFVDEYVYTVICIAPQRIHTYHQCLLPWPIVVENKITTHTHIYILRFYKHISFHKKLANIVQTTNNNNWWRQRGQQMRLRYDTTTATKKSLDSRMSKHSHYIYHSLNTNTSELIWINWQCAKKNAVCSSSCKRLYSLSMHNAKLILIPNYSTSIEFRSGEIKLRLVHL